MAIVIDGNNTPTAGGVGYGDGTELAFTAAGTSGQLVVSGGASAPAFRPYTLPAADGSASQVLQTNGSGALSFATPSSGGFTLGTPVVATSGTSINFTGIPAGTKVILILFKDVSTNGTSRKLIQIGDSVGIETTDYSSSGLAMVSTTATQTSSTSGFLINAVDTLDFMFGVVVLALENSTTFSWGATGSLAAIAASNNTYFICGGKSLSATLDRVRITTVNGTDTFDNGEINIAYI